MLLLLVENNYSIYLNTPIYITKYITSYFISKEPEDIILSQEILQYFITRS